MAWFDSTNFRPPTYHIFFVQIGSGRFSTVHMGNWHGDVAIKFLDMENLEDETTLEAFRLDVATFRYRTQRANCFWKLTSTHGRYLPYLRYVVLNGGNNVYRMYREDLMGKRLIFRIGRNAELHELKIYPI